MSSRLRSLSLVLSLTIPASLGAVACGASDAGSDAVGAAAESDLSGSAVLTLGAITTGQKRAAAYNSTPKWRAFSFTATRGDDVDFWVRSATGGDAEAFIVTAQFVTLASNTSADGVTKDARVKTTIPKTGSYSIVFRDSGARAASFEVEFVKPAVVVADAGTDSGTADAGPPPVMSDDPFDQTSCLGTPLTYAQALALANDGDSFEHGQTPNRLGRYALKTRQRTCDAAGNDCGPWTPTVDARFEGGYLGTGYAGDPFQLQGDVRIDKEGGIRVRVVDASVDSSPMYYPQSTSLQLSQPSGGIGPATTLASSNYEFGAPDLNNGSRTYVYGNKTAVWSTVVLTSTCLRMMSTPAPTNRDGNQAQYALVARF